jgi:hypothetical protein
MKTTLNTLHATLTFHTINVALKALNESEAHTKLCKLCSIVQQAITLLMLVIACVLHQRFEGSAIYGAEYGCLFLCLLKQLNFQLIALSADSLEFCLYQTSLLDSTVCLLYSYGCICFWIFGLIGSAI